MMMVMIADELIVMILTMMIDDDYSDENGDGDRWCAMRYVSDDGAPSDVSCLRLESADCLDEHLPRRPLLVSLQLLAYFSFS